MNCVAPSYDIWKLGCLLFEAATGTRLFHTQLREAYAELRSRDAGYSPEHYILDTMVETLGNIPRGVSAAIRRYDC